MEQLIVKSEVSNSNKITLDTNALPAGLYNAVVKSGTHVSVKQLEIVK
jgi:hypothetical protein